MPVPRAVDRDRGFHVACTTAGPMASKRERKASQEVLVAVARSTAVIRIEPGDWGAAPIEEIAAVLRSAAAELTMHIPDLPPTAILVEHTSGHPFALYHRSDHNEHLVRLSPRGRHWYQFAYEFSHELCHILCDHARYRHREERWFEESLCELASIFTLRRMAISWRRSPPYATWAAHASDFQEYVDDLLEESHRQLPAGVQLKDWYRANAEYVRLNAWDREKNELVASCLLPTFEERPEGWGAIPHLYPAGCGPVESFELHIRGWLRRTPDTLRPLIRAIADKFGIALHAMA